MVIHLCKQYSYCLLDTKDDNFHILSFCLLCFYNDLFILLTFFSKSSVSNKKIFRVFNSLELYQIQHFVEPDLGANCLQLLSAVVTSSQKVKDMR